MATEGKRREIVVMDRLWPLVLLDFPSHPNDDDWMQVFPIYEKFYARREPFQMMNDNTSLQSYPTAKVRKQMGIKAKELDHLAKRFLIGSAIVTPSAIARGALTAINWIAPPPYKQTVHATRLDALDEMLRTLEQHRLPVTESMRVYRDSLAQR
jgi:hypothetical protein